MLKGQDVLVLLKLAGRPGEWTFAGLAAELGISASEVHAALRRAGEAGLYDYEGRRVWRHALWELAVHGLRYVFPAKPGARQLGIPTAHSAPPLRDKLLVDAHDVYVWPHPAGDTSGAALPPIHPAAPDAALRDPVLHRRLALVDTLRAGGTRDRNLANAELKADLGLC